MSVINVTCQDQKLAITSSPVIASGGLEEDTVLFSFCTAWNGYAKTAVFWKDENTPYTVVLNNDDSCTIPHEVLTTQGTIYFGVYGVNTNEVRRTSEVIKYKIIKGAYTEAAEQPDPTPDVYTQLLAQYANFASKVDKVSNATANNFAGLDASGNMTDSGKNASNFHPAINELSAITAIADGDYIPLYDVSASGHKKTLWSNIIAKIRTALFGNTSGIAKLDGSGNISGATAGTDYQGVLTFDNSPTSGSNNPVKSGGIYTALGGKASTSHASTHASGGSDAVTPAAIGAAAASHVHAESDITGLTTDLSKRIQFVKLWENADPGSSFAAQTITVDLSSYDLVMVMYNYSKTSQGGMSLIGGIGCDIMMCATAGSSQSHESRSATTSTTGVEFEAASYNGATNNSQVIPVAIYGIKGVH